MVYSGDLNDLNIWLLSSAVVCVVDLDADSISQIHAPTADDVRVAGVWLAGRE